MEFQAQEFIENNKLAKLWLFLYHGAWAQAGRGEAASAGGRKTNQRRCLEIKKSTAKKSSVKNGTGESSSQGAWAANPGVPKLVFKLLGVIPLLDPH